GSNETVPSGRCCLVHRLRVLSGLADKAMPSAAEPSQQPFVACFDRLCGRFDCISPGAGERRSQSLRSGNTMSGKTLAGAVSVLALAAGLLYYNYGGREVAPGQPRVAWLT